MIKEIDESNLENKNVILKSDKELNSIIPEPKPIKELIIDSIISSRNFFVNNMTKKLVDPEDITSFKINLKIADEYLTTTQESNNKKIPNKYGEKLACIKEERNVLNENNNIPEVTTIVMNNKKDNKLELLNKKQERNEKLIEEELPKTKQINEKSGQLQLIPEKFRSEKPDEQNNNLVLSLYKNRNQIAFRKTKSVAPEWHAPWKLYRVISGHTGWVRSIDVDPTNNWFVTGSNDRIIKFWDLASGKLKLSLTGHINTVRGLVVSPRHPYLFSCSEDKSVKCWDLEQNKVVRNYHGHLSGVYSIALHPTLDIIITGGRDCVARVWDMRSRQQIFCLEGHNNSIASIAVQEFNPQVITGSHDSTVKLWDIRTGKCLNTLTHHKKSVRSVITHDSEYSFISGGCDNIKVWQCPEGKFLRNISGHNSIINSIALNKDNVLVSGADNGSIYLWDYKSGYNFQKIESKEQSGSLSAEAGVFVVKFDHSSTRMITGECDKTIKMWKEDEDATPETHPINY